VVLSLLLSASGAGELPQLPALSTERPFQPGERLRYTLSWLGISAGAAVMEVTDLAASAEGAAFRLITSAQSNQFISAFYPVDNRVESVVDADRLLPERLLFRRREGRRKNDFDVTFHHHEGAVTAIKDGVPSRIPIPPETHDALSCLYYIRSLPSLVPGASVFMNVHHNNKNYRLEVRVEGIERLRGPWKETEAVKVLAVMPFQGIFLNEGNIRIWLTNDARHVPLKMRAKVIIGSVEATLVEGWRAP
jgi:hypothetical protein